MASVAPIVVRFTVELQDGLENGIPVGYTTNVNDAVLAWYLSTAVGFDGTTPVLGVGYSSQTGSLYAAASVATAGVVSSGFRGGVSVIYDLVRVAALSEPLVAWVSQDGLRGGAAVGGTQGTATLVLLIAPAA